MSREPFVLGSLWPRFSLPRLPPSAPRSTAWRDQSGTSCCPTSPTDAAPAQTFAVAARRAASGRRGPPAASASRTTTSSRSTPRGTASAPDLVRARDPGGIRVQPAGALRQGRDGADAADAGDRGRTRRASTRTTRREHPRRRGLPQSLLVATTGTRSSRWRPTTPGPGAVEKYGAGAALPRDARLRREDQRNRDIGTKAPLAPRASTRPWRSWTAAKSRATRTSPSPDASVVRGAEVR